MRVLVDSDVFCALGIGNLLGDLLSALGADFQNCGRLPALPHMLRRGKLRKLYGEQRCADLMKIVRLTKPVRSPDALWLDRLTSMNDINPGEAQIFATAASDSLIVVTGDKRALLALRNVEGYPEALARRIVILEAAILVLCERLGCAEVQRRLNLSLVSHMTLRMCFSANNPDPCGALESYYRDFVSEVHPLLLWDPHGGSA